MTFERIAYFLKQSLSQNQVTNGGPLQKVLADELKQVTCSTREVILTASGTAALHALASAWSLRKGRQLRWATQAFTFPPSFQGPLQTMIVVDMDTTHFGPSVTELEAIVHEIDGIIVTNVFGFAANVTFYEHWCKENGKLLLFDNAATAVGVIENRCIHDFGDGSIISLHETKPIGRGEGGAIFCSQGLEEYVARAINFGFGKAINNRVGSKHASNYRMSDIAASAILDHLENMKNDGWYQKVENLADYAVSLLSKTELSLATPAHRPIFRSCLFIQLPRGMHSEKIVGRLNSKWAIQAKQYYLPLAEPSKCPKAWQLYKTTMCLPIHAQLSRRHIDYMLWSLCVLGSGAATSF